MLGGRGKDRSDTEVVCTGTLCCLRLFNCLCGCADDKIFRSLLTDLCDRSILDTDVYTVRTAFQRDLYIVINDERNMVGVAECGELFGLQQKAILIQFFFPKLDDGCSAF